MTDHQTRAANRQPETMTMTVTQAAIALGISRTTAYECVRLGSIPSLDSATESWCPGVRSTNC